MAELSFQTGRPIARIEGGHLDGKRVYLRDMDIPCCKSHCKECGTIGKYCCKNCIKLDDGLEQFVEYDEIERHLPKMSPRERLFKGEILRKALIKNVEPLDEDLTEIYHLIRTQRQKKKNKSLIVNDGKFIQVPSADGVHQRDVLYVTGMSGSGKSTYISNYISEYKRKFPKNRLIVISTVTEDKALDKHDPIRIMLDDDFIADPVKGEELADSLVIFDDTDTIKDKALQQAVNHLKDDCLETGRHHRIFMCVVSHMMSNHRETRIVLNECTSMTFFPQSGSVGQIKYTLNKYFGVDNNTFKKIMAIKSRAITIFKNYPQAVMGEHDCYLLSHLSEK